MKILVSGSIVLYKSGNSVRSAIESFLSTPLPIRLFLVDNSPTDELRYELAEYVADSRVEYIANKRNIGFGAAHNVALRKIAEQSVYHLILNPDVSFAENVLPSIYEFMELNPEVGLLMPKVLYPNSATQYICKLLPTPADLIVRRFLPEPLHSSQNNYDLKASGYNRLMEAPNLSGCFMFLRTNLLEKTGLFDEGYFLYLEDTDLSRRFYKVAKNVFYPEVHIIHDHERGSYKNLKLLLVHMRSAIRYFNKWGWYNDKERDRINKHTVASLTQPSSIIRRLKVRTA